MSADIPDVFPEFDGAVFDALMVDPVIRDLLKEIDEAARSSSLTKPDATEMMHKYDLRWQRLSLMHETAVISGKAKYPIPAESGGDELVSHDVNEVLARSEGFTVIIDDESDDPSHTLAMLFKELTFDEAGNQIGEYPLLVELDKVHYLRFEEVMSYKQAEAVLKYYAPHILARFQEVLDTSENEIEATEKLRGVHWDMSNMGKDASLVMRAISTYASEAIRYDSELPYVIPAGTSRAYVCSDDSESPLERAEVELTTNTAISINRLTYLSPLIPGTDTTWIAAPYLDCHVHNDHLYELSSRIMLPLDHVFPLISFRESFRISNGMLAAEKRDDQPDKSSDT